MARNYLFAPLRSIFSSFYHHFLHDVIPFIFNVCLSHLDYLYDSIDCSKMQYFYSGLLMYFLQLIPCFVSVQFFYVFCCQNYSGWVVFGCFLQHWKCGWIVFRVECFFWGGRAPQKSFTSKKNESEILFSVSKSAE